jgi:hypothetical protein
MPENKVKHEPVFQIRGVELNECSILASAYPQPEIFNFEARVEPKLDKENRLIVNVVTIRIYRENKTPVGTISCACLFSVTNFDEMVTYSKDNIGAIDPEFNRTLASISISTARGVLHGCVRGTLLHNAVLPLIDVKQMVSTFREDMASYAVAG